MKKLSFAVAVLIICTVVIKAQDKFKIQNIPLKITQESISYRMILAEPISQIVVGQKFIAFNSHRSIWIKFADKELTKLSDIVSLPNNFDWYQAIVIANDQLIASVAKYSEEQRKKENDAAPGGFIAGPEEVGLLIVDFKSQKVEIIDDVKIVGRPKKDYVNPYQKNSFIPSFQSAFWDGKEFYSGAYGYLYHLNLGTREAKLIEEDELSDSRPCFFKEGDIFWSVTNSGGLHEASIRKTHGTQTTDYYLLNSGELSPDKVLNYKTMILTSSQAGIIQIDEKLKKYIHYQISPDRKKMGVYNISIINAMLWGLPDDGIAKFDLSRRSAIHYNLIMDNKSVMINAYGLFDKAWYAATENSLGIIDFKK